MRCIRHMLAGGVLEAVGKDQCRWVTSLDTLEWLMLRILRLGCSVDVHGPPELLEHLRDVAARVVRSVPAEGPR